MREATLRDVIKEPLAAELKTTLFALKYSLEGDIIEALSSV